MKPYILLVLGITFSAASCLPAPTVPPTPAVDTIATIAVMQMRHLQTQTALAASPTPSITPAPTETPVPAETLTPEPTEPIKRPVTTAFAPCRAGPGPQYTHITNIEPKRYVFLEGIGSVPGWYVIREPYFRSICWIEAIYVKLDPRIDTSTFPVMTPTNP
jgi:hypothetical protein